MPKLQYRKHQIVIRMNLEGEKRKKEILQYKKKNQHTYLFKVCGVKNTKEVFPWCLTSIIHRKICQYTTISLTLSPNITNQIIKRMCTWREAIVASLSLSFCSCSPSSTVLGSRRNLLMKQKLYIILGKVERIIRLNHSRSSWKTKTRNTS